MPVLQPKTNEIAGLLNTELRKARSDELTMKRLERDLDALLRAPDSTIRTEALSLLGVVHGLRFDVDGTKQFFERALAASGYSPRVYVNYATTLAALGMPQESFAAVEKAFAKEPGEASTLSLAIKLASDNFDLDSVCLYAKGDVPNVVEG